MYDDDYTCYVVIWGKGNSYSLFSSLLGLRGIMGLHIHIVLVDLDLGLWVRSWDVLIRWNINMKKWLWIFYDVTIKHEYEYVLFLLSYILGMCIKAFKVNLEYLYQNVPLCTSSKVYLHISILGRVVLTNTISLIFLKKYRSGPLRCFKVILK